MERLTGRIQICLFLVILWSCSGLPFKETGPTGVYHRVKAGETLSEIAGAYHVDLSSIVKANHIVDVSSIEKDAVIFIPNAQGFVDQTKIISKAGRSQAKGAQGDTVEQRQVSTTHHGKISKKQKIGEKSRKQVSGNVLVQEDVDRPTKGAKVLTSEDHSDKGESVDKKYKPGDLTLKESRQQTRLIKHLFIWPLKGKVISFFGKQSNGMFFNGIKISPLGNTAVLAARDGVVIRSERLKYYGETVILQHSDDYATVYANLVIRAVDLKSRVKKGDRIGFIGDISENNRPYLYFEIRHKNRAKDPVSFLP